MGQGSTIQNRFKAAGKELISGNFGNAAKALLSPSTYRGHSGDFLTGVKGQYSHSKYNCPADYLRAYRENPVVSAIVNRKAGAFINGKTWILNRDGKAKGKESTSEAANKLRALLQKPNPVQNWKQFEAQAYCYKQIFGFNIVLIVKPVGFPNIDAEQIWNIPPNMLDIQESTVLFYSEGFGNGIKSLVLTYGGHRTTLDLDDIYIMRDFVPGIDSLIFPDSKLKSLTRQLNNLKTAYNIQGNILEDRGALGIISSEKSDESGKVSFTKTEKEALQEDFKSYGLTRGQWKYIITNAALKWQSIGFSTKELMLFEGIDKDIMRLCDGLQYPYPLLSSDKTNSLGGNQTDPNMTLLYQDFIVPDAELFYEELNLMFDTAKWKIIVDKDFKHVPALQKDQLKEAQARYNRNKALEIEFRYNGITLNRWRELNGEDTVADGNVYYSEIRELLGNPATTPPDNSKQEEDDRQLTG